MYEVTGKPDNVRPMGRARRDHGFTLIEVLVAFTIMATMLLALMQGMSQGLRAIDRAQNRQLVVEYARNTLALVGVDIPLESGVYSGEADDHVWEVSISPSPYALGPVADRYPMHLLSIEVHVRDNRGSQQYLTTMRLIEAAP